MTFVQNFGWYEWGMFLTWVIGGMLWAFLLLSQVLYQAYLFIIDEEWHLWGEDFFEQFDIDSGSDFGFWIGGIGAVALFFGGMAWLLLLLIGGIIGLMFLLRFLVRTGKKIDKVIGTVKEMEKNLDTSTKKEGE